MNVKDSSYQTALLVSLVGNRALKVYNDFVFDRGETKDDIKVVMTEFNNYFMPDKNVTYERHNFFLCNQKPGKYRDK